MSGRSAALHHPGVSACRHEFVTTDGFQPAERYEVWRDLYLNRCEPFGVGTDEADRFGASYRYLVIPEGEMTDLRLTASGLTRTRARCRTDGSDNIAISMTLSGGGAGWFSNPDLASTFESGFIRLRDEARPYVVQLNAAENRSLHLELPRANFDARTLDRILAAAGAPVPTGGLVPVLAAQMRSFAEIAGELDERARAAGLRSVLDLAATVLRLEYGAASAENEICEDAILLAAQTLICRRFAEPDLSPEAIARRVGCSRAHLYRVFSRHGSSVAGYLREIRLTRAHAALAAAGPRDTIGNIAFRSGFDNPVYFAHLFYQRFGMRPSDVLRRFSLTPTPLPKGEGKVGGPLPKGEGKVGGPLPKREGKVGGR